MRSTTRRCRSGRGRPQWRRRPGRKRSASNSPSGRRTDKFAPSNLPADLAFAGEDWSWLDDAVPLVTRDSAIQPHELAQLLRNGFFSPSDDAEADSYDTQLDRFDEHAQHLATRLLLSDDAGLPAVHRRGRPARAHVARAPGDRAVDHDRMRDRPDVDGRPSAGIEPAPAVPAH